MTKNEAIDKLNNLHYKILNCSFNQVVYESEIEALCMAKDCLKEIQQYRAIGTIEEFKDLKEKNEILKALYKNAREEGNNLIIKARAEAANEFANYLHEKAKENNGLRLSSETRSWTHPCIFDYLEEFKNEQICKEET